MLNLAILSTIPDHRRGQGRLFDLPHVLLCCILAVLAGADSYRSVYRFIDTRWEWLRQHTGLSWRRRPCYTGLYTILRGIDAAALEQVLRQQAAQLTEPLSDQGISAIALDGKILRASLDQAAQTPALQWLSAFRHLDHLVLGQIHWRDGDKNNEIAAAQQLIEELGLSGQLYTLDALHCQKNATDG
jgi:hypothetical protein